MALPDEVPPPPASGSVSTSACPSDEDLLAFALGRLDDARLAMVHAHLDECETCQRLLSEAVHSLAIAVTAPLPESDDEGWVRTFQPGTLVARRYLIQHFIARGGMGEVYEAFDREMQQPVALKTVTSTAGDNPRAVRRLKAEVQHARRVSHPNVCRIHDLGTHLVQPSGAQVHFLTMEFVEGETLGTRVRLAGALPLDEVRKVARELVLGLGAAHEAGILHRDFKSDNVILKSDAEGQSTAVILDFGLARALDNDPDQPASSSNPTLVGTFGYIAPEQLEGKAHTPASDIYAFGVVLFEMLTGQLPFESGSSPAVNALDRLQKRAPAPSSINPSVPSAFDAVVARCLRRLPEDRFQSAQEVLAALDAIRDVAPRKRSSLRVLAIAAAVVALSLGAYFAIQSLAPANAPPAISDERAPGSPGKLGEKTADGPLFIEPALPEPRAVTASDNTAPRAAASGSAKSERSPRELPPVATSGAENLPSAPALRSSVPASASPPDVPAESPSPSGAPATPAPERSKKPDWENPFGTLERPRPPAGEALAPT